jgi:hypothetical protein
MVIVTREADLFEVVGTAQTGSGFANLLNGWKKKADQDADDRDDHKQLYKRKCRPGVLLR